ncbi:DUF5009 domain-containing protein [Inhella gelatinilytica]|uniref:DUF5009 domain-containing protein n=1 Tax=Inhella gelatinilytica TaxID=2795030 RepID=A0A931IZ29_9BURK|nr:DUF5009 domain-containing protein [Inhella gelatinilytica]MBH9552623.1 DUF5009 domain-containing protein [Inhella gelatinilytica]
MSPAAPFHPPRDSALDALRGLAVFGMVLSGSVGFGAQAGLPAWMYHVQVPPPLHKFDGSIPGISWVDLVFPMFLFALGAALPLALRGQTGVAVAWTAVRRGALLLFLALVTHQFKNQGLLSLAAFGLLGLMLVRRVPYWGRVLAGVAVLGLWSHLGITTKNDIILAVLAVMACVGTLIWGVTRVGSGREPWRWALLVAVVAVMLAPPTAWTRGLQATPAPWAYQFVFLKYLLIVVPGMAVGEGLLRVGRDACGCSAAAGVDRLLPSIALTLVCSNLTLLYLRESGWNFALSAALLAWGAVRVRREEGFVSQAWSLAAGLLMLGLLLEPLQGGIRKDPSTFSYLVVTAALSLLLLLALQGVRGPLREGLAGLGRNPLLAYVVGSLCLLPLLHLGGLHAAWTGLAAGPALSLLKGLLFTVAGVLLTLGANRLGWVWRA